jgi:hypothetical protein
MSGVFFFFFYFPINPAGSNFELEAAQIGRRADRSMVRFGRERNMGPTV